MDIYDWSAGGAAELSMNEHLSLVVVNVVNGGVYRMSQRVHVTRY